MVFLNFTSLCAWTENELCNLPDCQYNKLIHFWGMKNCVVHYFEEKWTCLEVSQMIRYLEEGHLISVNHTANINLSMHQHIFWP